MTEGCGQIDTTIDIDERLSLACRSTVELRSQETKFQLWLILETSLHISMPKWLRSKLVIPALDRRLCELDSALRIKPLNSTSVEVLLPFAPLIVAEGLFDPGTVFLRALHIALWLPVATHIALWLPKATHIALRLPVATLYGF